MKYGVAVLVVIVVYCIYMLVRWAFIQMDSGLWKEEELWPRKDDDDETLPRR